VEADVLAARWYGKMDLRLEDLPDPDEPPHGWVRVRVEACGICGSDLAEFTAGPRLIPVSEPNPLTGAVAPITLGHEPSGVVEDTGDGVELATGTRVAIECNLFCGDCYWCRRKDFQLCPQLTCLGLMTDGALATYVLAPAHMCVPIADHVPMTSAALAEPLSVAVRAVRRACVRPGSTVAIVGAGTIGLLVAQVARTAGAASVMVAETHERRRRLALDIGADVAVSPADAAAAMAELSGGVGFDTTIEAAGAPAAVRTAADLARRGGRITLVGVNHGDFEFPIEMLSGEKEITTSVSHRYDTDFAEAVELINTGQVDVESMITDRVPLRAAVDAFTMLIDEPDQHLKVLVIP
jgi:(R,R)-butanediol dehydrogenase/meso-butanediol dehydrogenase/diacetyl reductase